MGLADTFQEIVDALSDDWTDLTLDLRIFDEDRYIDASVYLVQCNPQPYSKYDWHWKILVSHRFGHSASAPTVHGTLKLLDDPGSTASCGSATRAPGASRSSRCGAGRSPCARSSAGSARSSPSRA